MKRIGLTGGVGMGKTTVGELLRQRGLPIADTDVLARMLVQPGQPALELITKLFGEEFRGTEGQLRRDLLAKRVFADASARKELEDILHPRIRELWRGQVARWAEQGVSAGVVVIPLLFETGAEKDFDFTVCVACSDQTQRARLRERGWSDEQMEQRIAAQWPVIRKMDNSSFVIWTEGAMEATASQVDRVLKEIGFNAGPSPAA